MVEVRIWDVFRSHKDAFGAFVYKKKKKEFLQKQVSSFSMGSQQVYTVYKFNLESRHLAQVWWEKE